MSKRVTKFLVEVAYIEGSADLTVTVADSLNNWLDAADYLVGVPRDAADDLNNLADAEIHTLGYEWATADDLNNWLDAVRVAITGAALSLAVADSLDNWVDGAEYEYANNADPLLYLGDRLILADEIEIFVGSPIELSDDLNNWGDEVQIVLVIPISVEDTNEYSWADSVVVSVPIVPYLITKADNMGNLADAIALQVGHHVLVGDTLVMADSVASLFSYLHALGDSLNAWADAIALLINTAPGEAADSMSLSDDASVTLIGVLTVDVSDSMGTLADAASTASSCAYNDANFRSYIRRWLNDV